MIKYPFTPAELLNRRNLDVMNRFAAAYQEEVARDPATYGSIVVEGLGSWLVQDSYHDRTGFYLRFRLSPLDRGRPAVQELGRRLMARFVDMFPGRNANGTRYEGRPAIEDGESVTVLVETDLHSIGD